MRELLRGIFFNFNFLTKKYVYMFKKSTTAPKLIINFNTHAWLGVPQLQTAEAVLIAVEAVCAREELLAGGPQQGPAIWGPHLGGPEQCGLFPETSGFFRGDCAPCIQISSGWGKYLNSKSNIFSKKYK